MQIASAPQLPWDHGTKPLPAGRTHEVDVAVGELLVRNPGIEGWAEPMDAVVPVFNASPIDIEGPSFAALDDAVEAARLRSAGPDRPAIGIERSYANDPTRRVFRLIDLLAPRLGRVMPLHIATDGTTDAGVLGGTVIDTRLGRTLAGVVDGEFVLLSEDRRP